MILSLKFSFNWNNYVCCLSNLFADILGKIFKKKIKRNKAGGADEDDEDDDDDDDEDDDDEVRTKRGKEYT